VCVDATTWGWCSYDSEIVNVRKCNDSCRYRETALGTEGYCYPHGPCVDTCP
jgi:hypothetical protein